MKVFRITDASLIATSKAIQAKLKASGKLVYKPATGFADYINQIKTGSGTAKPADVLEGVTFTGDDGIERTGTIPKKNAQTYTPKTTNQTIAAGQYLNQAQTILGDPNLTSDNIKAGASIFGTKGNVIQASGNAQANQILQGITASNAAGSVTGTIPTYEGSNIIEPSRGGTTLQTAGKYLASNLNVMGDLELKPDNIRKDVTIFGQTGSLEEKLPNYLGSNVVYPSASGTILPTNNTTLTSDINVRGDKNFKAENIKKDVTIWNVKGTFDPTPKPYTPLEYIETNGTNYIDTVFKPNPVTTKIECNFEILEVPRGYSCLFGVYDGEDKDTQIFLQDNRFRLDYIGDYTTYFNYSLNTLYSIICDNNVVTINGTRYGGTIAKVNTYLPYSFPIGAIAFQGNLNKYPKVKAKFYNFKIWDNGVLVRDMIPCVMNGSQELGMWDLVDNKFYHMTPNQFKPSGPEVKTITITSKQIQYNFPKPIVIVGVTPSSSLYLGKTTTSVNVNDVFTIKSFTNRSLFSVFITSKKVFLFTTSFLDEKDPSKQKVAHFQFFGNLFSSDFLTDPPTKSLTLEVEGGFAKKETIVYLHYIEVD